MPSRENMTTPELDAATGTEVKSADNPPSEDSSYSTVPADLSGDLYEALIGPHNREAYLQRFSRFDARGKAGLDWHWGAFVSALNWLLYRGMWGAALLYSALMLAAMLGLFGIARLVIDMSGNTTLVLFAAFMLASSVLAALLAHGAFYRFCKKRILETVGLSDNLRDARRRLAEQAATQRRLFVLLIVNLALATLVIWVYQHMPVATSPSASAMPAKVPPPFTGTVSLPPDASRPANPPASPASSEAPAVVEKAVEVKSAPEASAESKPVDTVQAASRPAQVTATPESSAAAAPERRYFVQVGVFAVEGNAHSLQEKLEAEGFRVHTLGLQTPKGVMIQVRVGPYAGKSDAQQAATKLQTLNVPTYVLKLEP